MAYEFGLRLQLQTGRDVNSQREQVFGPLSGEKQGVCGLGYGEARPLQHQRSLHLGTSFLERLLLLASPAGT